MNTIPTPLPEELNAALYQAIGAASMCWNPLPGNQVFDTASAKRIGDVLALKIDKELAASRELTRQYKEVAEELKYCIETEFGAFSIPCRGTLAKLEALNQSVMKTDAEI